MQLIRRTEEYYDLIQNKKNDLGLMKTNCLLSRDEVERYVSLKRFFCEEVDSGIFFYSDEDWYYQMYIYTVADGIWRINKKDKPVLFQYIYRNKKPWYEQVEQQLCKNQFLKEDTCLHMTLYNAGSLLEKMRTISVGIEKLFNEYGFAYREIYEDEICYMLDFIKEIDEIPYYQIPFYTKEEYVEESSGGRLSCIVDKNNDILAARHLIVNRNKAYGWVGIKEEYRTLYGFTPYILYRQLEYIEKNGIEMCSWVKTTNTASLKYHERIGSVETGYIKDEWILGKQ